MDWTENDLSYLRLPPHLLQPNPHEELLNLYHGSRLIRTSLNRCRKRSDTSPVLLLTYSSHSTDLEMHPSTSATLSYVV